MSSMFAKIDVPNLVAYLNRTPIFWVVCDLVWLQERWSLQKNVKVKAQICCFLRTPIIWDIHMNSKNDEEGGDGLDVDFANAFVPIACLMS